MSVPGNDAPTSSQDYVIMHLWTGEDKVVTYTIKGANATTPRPQEEGEEWTDRGQVKKGKKDY